MRLLFLALLAGCTAVTDFSQFHEGTSDLAAPLPGFGEPCTTAGGCDPGPGHPFGRDLVCVEALGDKSGSGLCSRACTPGAGACSDYGIGAVCANVSGTSDCVRGCLLPATPCSDGQTCCNAGVPVTTGRGACVPHCP